MFINLNVDVPRDNKPLQNEIELSLATFGACFDSNYNDEDEHTVIAGFDDPDMADIFVERWNNKVHIQMITFD